MEAKFGHSYIINISVNSKNISMIVRNEKQVPNIIIETMARERIKKEINETYTTHKHYRVQTFEQFYDKTIKQSDFEINDLSNVEVYDLNLGFDNENNIINNSNGKTKTIESRFNKISNESFLLAG